MKIMLDTNVLISGFVFGGRIGRLLFRLFETNHEIYISEYVENEFIDKIYEKFPAKAEKASQIFKKFSFRRFPSTSKITMSMDDRDDIQILNDAIEMKVDILVTGDDDFHRLDIEKPIIMKPRELADFLGIE